MIDFDFSKIPFGGKLSKADQIEFERRAHIVDDNDDPPVILDENGKPTLTLDEK